MVVLLNHVNAILPINAEISLFKLGLFADLAADFFFNQALTVAWNIISIAAKQRNL